MKLISYSFFHHTRQGTRGGQRAEGSSARPERRQDLGPARLPKCAGAWCFLAVAGIIFQPLVARAQNLLPFEWKLHFSSGPVAGLAAPDADGNYPVNLLYSWERQGFSGMNGMGTLSCDFVLPSKPVPSGLALSVHLLCRVERVSINGVDVHGPIPAPSRDPKSATAILVPDGCLRPGKNRIEMTVSDLGYTGGLSHNFCRLSTAPISNDVGPSVAIEVASSNHVFVDKKPIATVRYYSPKAGQLRVLILNDFHDKMAENTFPISAGEGTLPLDLDSLSEKSGFYECTVILDGGGYAGVVEWLAVSPERIQCRTTTGAGFNAYWANALKELNAVKPDFRMRKVAEWCTEDRDGYEVDIKSLGNVEVKAYYFVPRSSGPHAAIMHVPGYGQRYRPQDFISNHENVAELALFVRGHEPNSPGRFEPPNGPTLWGYKIYDAHEYAYRGVYMDCVRGIDFLLSQREIDPKRIGVMGASQGGGLTLATAGLCGTKIAACAYGAPWPCDLRDHVQIRTLINGELKGFKEYYHNQYSVEQFQRVLDLVDTRNFGPAITCPVLFCAGMFDDDCPPHVGFAFYNLIKTEKQYLVYPEGSHTENGSYWKDVRAFFKTRFKY